MTDAARPTQKRAAAKKSAATKKAAGTRSAGKPAAKGARTTVAKKAPAKKAAASAPVVERPAEPVSGTYVLVDPHWLERAYRLGVGSAVLAAASSGRVLGVPGGQLAESLPSDEVIDFGVGLSDSVFSVLQRTIGRVSKVVAPFAGVLRQPLEQVLDRAAEALLPVMEPVAERGRRRRAEAEQEMAALVESLIPDITDLILDRIDLQAVLSRIDLQELVEASLDHIDMQSVMEKMDMSEALDHMMGQLDLTQVALDHVDMNRIMENAIKQVDMVALVRSQLEGMDLTELLISTPTSLATGALRQTTRFVRRG